MEGRGSAASLTDDVDTELNCVCVWVCVFSVSHSESEGEVQDNRPSIDFSDLEDDSEEEF